MISIVIRLMTSIIVVVVVVVVLIRVLIFVSARTNKRHYLTVCVG